MSSRSGGEGAQSELTLPEKKWLESAAVGLQPRAAAALLDADCTCSLNRTFSDAHADEGTFWVVDEATNALTPVWNSGASASRFVLNFSQPLDAGIISMVFVTEQPFMENRIDQNPRRDQRLDRVLGVQTLAQIAVPVYLSGHCRGVISCVHLCAAGETSPRERRFVPADLLLLQRASTRLSGLLERRLLQSQPSSQ